MSRKDITDDKDEMTPAQSPTMAVDSREINSWIEIPESFPIILLQENLVADEIHISYRISKKGGVYTRSEIQRNNFLSS